jgi:hypothetical protein
MRALSVIVTDQTFFVQTCNPVMETCSAPVGKIVVTADQNSTKKPTEFMWNSRFPNKRHQVCISLYMHLVNSIPTDIFFSSLSKFPNLILFDMFKECLLYIQLACNIGNHKD